VEGEGREVRRGEGREGGKGEGTGGEGEWDAEPAGRQVPGASHWEKVPAHHHHHVRLLKSCHNATCT